MLGAEPVTYHCDDCGRERFGAFCSHCGQRHGRHDLSLRHVLGELLNDFTHWDARALKTLRLLVLHPGQLTQECLKGRRTRFVPPLRLYIFLSFLLFLVLGLAPGGVKVEGRTVITGTAQAEPAPPAREAPRAAAPGAEDGRLEEGVRRAASHPEAFKEHMFHWFSHVMFLLLPAFAALLALLYLRSRRYFVEHVIFSIHFHCYAFLVFLTTALLNLVPWKPAGTAGGFLVLTLPPYLGFAMKRVYGGPVWKVLVKGALLTAAYLILVGAALAAVVIWLLRA